MILKLEGSACANTTDQASGTTSSAKFQGGNINLSGMISFNMAINSTTLILNLDSDPYYTTQNGKQWQHSHMHDDVPVPNKSVHMT